MALTFQLPPPSSTNVNYKVPMIEYKRRDSILNKIIELTLRVKGWLLKDSRSKWDRITLSQTHFKPVL